MKLLSILIPAYQFPEGIGYILKILATSNPDLVEIIIGDDSEDFGTMDLVAKFQNQHKDLVLYERNQPSLGAVSNWNSLLDKASGKYVLLLHHDEFPLGDNWVDHLINELDKNRATDLIVMPCVLFKGAEKKIRLHLPMFIQFLVLKYFPEYLFKRNVIGPISCLIIRREIYPRFDTHLRWLVDVDLYWRLFSSSVIWKISKDLKIASIVNRKQSITNSLSNNINKIRNGELAYLYEKYSKKIIWLLPSAHRIACGFEAFGWLLFKGLYIVYSYFINVLQLLISMALKRT